MSDSTATPRPPGRRWQWERTFPDGGRIVIGCTCRPGRRCGTCARAEMGDRPVSEVLRKCPDELLGIGHVRPSGRRQADLVRWLAARRCSPTLTELEAERTRRREECDG